MSSRSHCIIHLVPFQSPRAPTDSEEAIYLDTHVVAWLYAGRVDLLSTRARTLIDAEELRISPSNGSTHHAGKHARTTIVA